MKNSHMITFTLQNGFVATLRTSGTEPKIKCYAEYCAAPGNRLARSRCTRSPGAPGTAGAPSLDNDVTCPEISHLIQVCGGGRGLTAVSVLQRRVGTGGGAAAFHGCSAGRVPGAGEKPPDSPPHLAPPPTLWPGVRGGAAVRAPASRGQQFGPRPAGGRH